MMPVMNGYELGAAIEKRYPAKKSCSCPATWIRIWVTTTAPPLPHEAVHPRDLLKQVRETLDKH